MKFSLIIGTLDRPAAFESCYRSLNAQKFKDFEIIVIDQSDNDETADIVKRINDERIIYRHVNFRGLSRARNEALKLASGDYFCLIDDDAYYHSDYLATASKKVSPKVILSGYIFDTIKKGDFVGYDSSLNNKKLSMRKIIRTCPSAGLVFPRKVLEDCGAFDERFGVGSLYGAAEETEMIFRALKKGYCVKYIKNMRLKHPVPVVKSGELTPQKAKAYFRGFGALYRKHFSVQTVLSGYLENWIKLIIKRIVYRGEKKEIVKAQIQGFVEGFAEFSREKSK